jgi:hypothetical protein
MSRGGAAALTGRKNQLETFRQSHLHTTNPLRLSLQQKDNHMPTEMHNTMSTVRSQWQKKRAGLKNHKRSNLLSQSLELNGLLSIHGGIETHLNKPPQEQKKEKFTLPAEVKREGKQRTEPEIVAKMDTNCQTDDVTGQSSATPGRSPLQTLKIMDGFENINNIE